MSLLLENLDRNLVAVRGAIRRSRQWPTTAQFDVQCARQEIRVDHCVISLRRANTLKSFVKEFRWYGEDSLIQCVR